MSNRPSPTPAAPVRTDVDALQAEVDRLRRKLAEVEESTSARIASLEEAVTARDMFLSIAAHELRNPMAAMAARVQLMVLAVERTPDAPIGQFVSRLQALDRQVRHFIGRATTLLDIVRMGEGRFEPEFEPMDAAALVRDVAERHVAEAERAGTRVDLEIPDSLEGEWDPRGFDQVVSNLVSNAIKYGSPEPIRVVLERRSDGGVVLRVIDRGVGISVEDRARIFERFERAVPARERGGFGLGLWIVRQIVESFGGSIAVESRAGAGSTFTVTLPPAAASLKGCATYE